MGNYRWLYLLLIKLSIRDMISCTYHLLKLVEYCDAFDGENRPPEDCVYIKGTHTAGLWEIFVFTLIRACIRFFQFNHDHPSIHSDSPTL